MENKQFYIRVNGQEVEVTEEVYRAYVRPVSALRRRERRESRCLVKGRRYGLVRCKADCGKCPYYSAGNKLRGGVLSLDALREAGYDFPDVVKTTVLLQSIGDFAAMNAVYAEFFTGDKPARVCYEVAALPMGARVEIDAVAVK